MRDRIVYGVVVSGVFYSSRMELDLHSRITCVLDNGIYSIDTDHDDFPFAPLKPADIEDAIKYFKRVSKVSVIRGTSFHDGIVPENPISYEKIPIRVTDPNYDEFESIEVVLIKNSVCYFLRTMDTARSYALLDLKEKFKAKAESIADIKEVTPDMRIVYSFHMLEREQKKLAEPVNVIKHAMTSVGARVRSIDKTNTGFVVIWEVEGHTLNTLLDKKFRVVEAGFCVSGYDDTQSATSVVNLFKDYVRDGDGIYITRSMD